MEQGYYKELRRFVSRQVKFTKLKKQRASKAVFKEGEKGRNAFDYPPSPFSIQGCQGIY